MSVAEIIPAETRSLRLERVFDAPRALVFQCWTDPARMAAWWAPLPYTMPSLKLDVRPGGRIEAVMRAPDGSDQPFQGEFLEVEAPALLVFRSWIDTEDGVLFENKHHVRFEEDGDRTRLTLDITVVSALAEAAPYLKGMSEGWTMCLDQLTEIIARPR